MLKEVFVIKITIDTKEDSHEEIKKVIRMLSSLVGEEKIYSNQNIFEDSSPSVTPSVLNSDQNNAFANMFSTIESTPSSVSETASKPEDKPPKIQIIDY